MSSDTATAAARQVVKKGDSSPIAGFNTGASDEAPTQRTAASAANAAAVNDGGCESNSMLHSTHTDTVAEASAPPPVKRRKVLTLPRFVPPATTANNVPSTMNGAAAKDAEPPAAAAPECSIVQTHRHATCNEATPDPAAAASFSAAQDKNSVAAAALAASLQAQKAAAGECVSAAAQMPRQAVGATKPPASTAFKAPQHKQSTKPQPAGSVQKQPNITVQPAEQPAQVPAAAAAKREAMPKGTSHKTSGPTRNSSEAACSYDSGRQVAWQGQEALCDRSS